MATAMPMAMFMKTGVSATFGVTSEFGSVVGVCVGEGEGVGLGVGLGESEGEILRFGEDEGVASRSLVTVNVTV